MRSHDAQEPNFNLIVMIIRRRLISILCSLALLTGCAVESTQSSVVTPADFVGAVKQVSLHNDLADYQYTARALRITLTQEPQQVIHDPMSGGLLGHATSVHPNTLPIRFSMANFEYRTFYPENEIGHRTQFILNINLRNFCVLRDDVLAQFGQPEKRERNPHSDIDGFDYSPVDRLRMYFAFSLHQECLIFISSFQESISLGAGK